MSLNHSTNATKEPRREGTHEVGAVGEGISWSHAEKQYSPLVQKYLLQYFERLRMFGDAAVDVPFFSPSLRSEGEKGLVKAAVWYS